MAQLRNSVPYIWTTWVSKIIVGGHSCEWAAWFQAHHESQSWDKVPTTFDSVAWQMAHTAQINAVRNRWEADGYTVYTEAQNSFYLLGRTATLGGKADLLAVRGEVGTVIDVKAGQPGPAHFAQVMAYMYAIPRALEQHRGIRFSGQVAYPDHCVDIPASAVDDGFIGHLASVIGRIASDTPARRTPSYRECQFCPITSLDCPERVGDANSRQGETEDF